MPVPLAAHARILVACGTCLFALLGDAAVVVEERDDLLGAIADVDPDVAALVVLALKVLEALDLKDVIACVGDDALGAVLDQVLEERQRLVHVAPQLAALVELARVFNMIQESIKSNVTEAYALVDHGHDLLEFFIVVRRIGNILHQLSHTEQNPKKPGHKALFGVPFPRRPRARCWSRRGP